MMGALGLALAIVASGTSGPTTSLLSPASTLDQSYASRPSTCGARGWAPDDTTSWAAQTFTAGFSGSLTDVVMTLGIRTPEISVAITPVDKSGQPVVLTPLAFTKVAVAANTTYQDVAVSFPTPARVEAGKQYGIVLSSANEDFSNGVFVVWIADLGPSASDGSGPPCATGAYAGGRAWVMGAAPLGADADFFFQTYVVRARQLTVEKSGTGAGLVQDGTRRLDCGSMCSTEFLQGQSVTLTVTPNPGSIFSGWSGGGCTGTGSNCSVTLNADTTVTADFAKKLVSLTARRVGAGTVTSLPSGITCGKKCSYGFIPGQVTLTARPSVGWQFARWQGACRGTEPICRLRLLHASTVTAAFEKTRR